MARMGYDTALSRLRDLLTESMCGSGRLALVEGGLAGGKTHLLHEFSRQAVRSGALVLSATGSRAERKLSLGVVDQLFRSAGPAGPLPEHAARLIGAASEPAGSGGAGPSVTQRTTDTAARELCGLLLDLCTDQPLVLAVDDVQFADDPSLRLLLSLQRRMSGSRLLIVLNEWYRGKPTLPELRAELTRHPYSHIRLTPLSAEDITTLFTKEGVPDAARLAHGYHRLTGGNPLLLHAALDDRLGALCVDGEAEREGPVAGAAYAQAVLAGLYRWDAELLSVARAAAVLGDRSSPALIAQLLDSRLADTEELVHILTDAGLLLDGRIRHPRGACAILEGMPHGERSDLHTRVARLLAQGGATAVDVARHLLAAGEAPEAWAVSALRDAAEHALTAGDAETAVRCLRLAVDADTDPQERHSDMYALTRVLWRRNCAAATAYLPRLRGAVAAGQLPVSAAVGVVRYSLWHGEVEEAVRTAAALCATPEGLDPRSAAELSATFHWYFGSDRRLRTAGTDGVRVTARRGTWAHAVDRMTTFWVRGGGDTASTSAQHILQSCHVGDTALEVVAGALLALQCDSKPHLARSWCERLVQEAARSGDLTWQAVLGSIGAAIALRLGDLTAAVQQAEQALRLLPVKAWGILIGLPRATLIAAHTSLGDHDAAAQVLRQPVPDAMFETFLGLYYLEARGGFFLATDQALAAGGDFQLCGSLMHEWEADLPTLNPWRANLAQVNLELGHTAEARELIRQQLERTRSADARLRGISLRVLAAASEPARRPALLRQSVEFLTAAQDRLELARALNDFSLAHQKLGEFDQARLLARRATQVTRACLVPGPVPGDEAGTEQERTPQAGWHPQEHHTRQVLSEAERRVAELAALGHTNREISQMLYITVSTVEQHLTRVYRKLGITRRTDLLSVYKLRGQNAGDDQVDLAAGGGLLPAGREDVANCVRQG
ncbi:AAA family ATPase [Streptomyces sp. NPDC088763]|uniref:AAA family ATPase n=1 Tax=Streptomyces sp. NPDC088763 TaxID=3365892 RepID=UPI003809BC56